VDLASMGVELTDFYGVETANPPIARVRVPILAWFGTTAMWERRMTSRSSKPR
jgi:hypothetical protein